MSLIEKPDRPLRRPIPNGIKIVLMLAVIFGIYLKSCWDKKRDSFYEITEIEFADQTLSSVDVYFVVANKTKFERDEPILIKLYTDRGEEIASRITNINMQPMSKRRYMKRVESWSRPLYEGERLDKATIEIFKTKIL